MFQQIGRVEVHWVEVTTVFNRPFRIGRVATPWEAAKHTACISPIKTPDIPGCHRLAPPQPTVLRRRQRPRHLKIEPNLFIFAWLPCWFWLDLRALFILITIYPWCFPSFLRSGKTPTKNCFGVGVLQQRVIHLVRRWVIGRQNFGSSLFFQLGIPFRIKPSTFAPSLCDNGTINLMDAVILTISKNYLMMWHVWIKLDGMTFTRQVRRWYQVDDMVWAIKPTHSPLTFTPNDARLLTCYPSIALVSGPKNQWDYRS